MRPMVRVIFVVVVLTVALVSLPSYGSMEEEIRGEIEKSLKSLIPVPVVVGGMKLVRADAPIPDGEDERLISVEPVKFSPPSRALFQAQVEKKGGVIGRFLYEVSYDTIVTVFVTTKPLSRGTLLSSGDFYALPQRASQVPVGSVTDIKELEGKRLRSNLAQGVVMKSAYIEKSGLVRRGQKVRIEVRGRGVVLTAPGKLAENGKVGEIVKVLCDVSRRVVTGMLVSPGKVLISL